MACERVFVTAQGSAYTRLKRVLYEDALAGYEERPTPTRFGDVLAAADVTLNSLALVLPVVEGVKDSRTSLSICFHGAEVGCVGSYAARADWAPMGTNAASGRRCSERSPTENPA
jgi:hypothetical protein